MFEDTCATLVREMREELKADIYIQRLLWVCEDFYEYAGSKVHELCFYYLASFLYPEQIRSDGSFWVKELDGTDLEFVWLPIVEVREAEIYPRFLRNGLLNLPEHIERLVDMELGH